MAKAPPDVEMASSPPETERGDENRALLQGPPETQETSKLSFTVEEAMDSLGFGKFQALLLGYTGMAWVAEAMEMMLLSFVGPAVRSEWGLDGWQVRVPQCFENVENS